MSAQDWQIEKNTVPPFRVLFPRDSKHHSSLWRGQWVHIFIQGWYCEIGVWPRRTVSSNLAVPYVASVFDCRALSTSLWRRISKSILTWVGVFQRHLKVDHSDGHEIRNQQDLPSSALSSESCQTLEEGAASGPKILVIGCCKNLTVTSPEIMGRIGWASFMPNWTRMGWMVRPCAAQIWPEEHVP